MFGLSGRYLCICVCLIGLWVGLSFGQEPATQPTTSPSTQPATARLHHVIRIEKDKLLPFEPVLGTTEITNVSDSPVDIRASVKYRSTFEFKSNPDADWVELREWWEPLADVGIKPTTLAPGEVYTEHWQRHLFGVTGGGLVQDPEAHLLTLTPGQEIKIRMVYYGMKGGPPIESNELTLQILPVPDNEREAYEFLQADLTKKGIFSEKSLALSLIPSAASAQFGATPDELKKFMFRFAPSRYSTYFQASYVAMIRQKRDDATLGEARMAEFYEKFVKSDPQSLEPWIPN